MIKEGLFGNDDINIIQHKSFIIKNDKNIKNMMLIKLENKGKATEVLCKYHNMEINGKLVKISFTNN